MISIISILYWVFILLKVFILYLLADFITGIFHWLEDTYTIPFMNVLCFNRLHHLKPHYMLKFSNFETISSTLQFTAILCTINLLFIKSTNFMISLLFMSLANLIHKLAHTSRKQKHLIINLLQKIGIIQSFKHHQIHHNNTDKYYCVMSNYLNPMLEYINFWRRTEKLIEYTTGIKPRTMSDKEVIEMCQDKKILKN